ncbi:MAG: tRNA 2-thiouridine(34) synthase MnmA [Patescibacteria group bacterium]|nr:tRNA 2-thiouridine(34) synthase MnmA [Patescibacteria group bacterium]
MTVRTPKKAKIVVAMSGGIDSSVVAALLRKQGYNCVGVYMQFWFDGKSNAASAENKCCSRESMLRAQKIAARLGMQVCVLDVSKKFKERVVDYFIDSHKKIITPNPCVMCNKTIKFGALLDFAKSMGADYVATGHYVKVIKKGNKYELHAGKDKDKDQSYFLYKLDQDQLKHVIFPLGNYTKDQVRRLAQKLGVKEVKKIRESQGVCFFPEKDHTPFLKRYLTKRDLKKGPIKTVDGEAIGEHEGLALYTIGQRKGIGIGGTRDPWYVAGLDAKNNTLIVGKNKDTFTQEMKIKNLSFSSGGMPQKPIKVKAKIRHRFPVKSAVLEIKKGTGYLRFAQKQRAITPGQSVVFYEGSKVLGGGEIV